MIKVRMAHVTNTNYCRRLSGYCLEEMHDRGEIFATNRVAD